MEFMLTSAQGKRLMARGILENPAVRSVLENGRLLIMAGTTNGYIAEELLRKLGSDLAFDRRAFRRGVTTAPNASPATSGIARDLLIEGGKAFYDHDVFAIAPTLGAKDMIFKGANAYHPATGECGVLIGSTNGGTLTAITAAAIGMRVQVLAPVGLEKRVDAPISELARLVNGPEGTGPRLWLSPATAYTEIDAIRDLSGCKATLIAAGGIMGAEGGIWLAAEGSREAQETLKSILAQLKDEPPTAV